MPEPTDHAPHGDHGDDFPAWVPNYEAHKGAGKRKQPTGAVIEIIERGRSTTDSGGGSVVTPNEVRINGQPLFASADHPVVVHEINSSGDDVVRVTLTLIARRVTIAAEGDTS
jgi:hypothetical protein